MNILRKIALPCGIAGSVCTILLSVFVYMAATMTWTPTAILRDQTGQVISSEIGEALTNNNLLLLIVASVTAMMGVLTLIAILSLKKRPKLRNVLIWVSIAFILTFGLLSVGFIILPVVILLILAAIGMQDYGPPVDDWNK